MNESTLIKSVFGKNMELSSEAFEFLKSSFEVKDFSARELITEAGDVEHYFYLVVSGVQAIYLITDKGEKVILGFSFQGSPSGAFDSFINETPSSLFLEALTSSRLLAMNRKSFTELFERYPSFYKWKSDFLETILLGRLSREVEMLTYSAKQRFDVFMKRCPKELLEIPQKYLASYLNMKPETFSRLRALKD
ncbi:MAG: Crp/Fnr family transcriptional regulator [Ekhidna sp.]